MSPITLKANESKILVAAASNGGLVAFPTRLKDVTRQRMAGLFAQHGLAEAVDDALQLTRAGYRAVGLRHRARRAFRCAMSCVTSCSASKAPA